jgi:hypothetical protein
MIIIKIILLSFIKEMPINHSMSHRFITNNKSNLNIKYVVGSGVGSRNRSVYRSLQRRASNNAQGKPCCMSTIENNK